MIVTTILNFFLCAFGFSSSMKTSVNSWIRTAFVVLNIVSVSSGLKDWLHSILLRHSDYLPTLAYVYGSLQDALIYAWRLRVGDLQRSTSHRKSLPFCLASAILVSANLGILLITISDVIHGIEAQRIGRLASVPSDWRFLSSYIIYIIYSRDPWCIGKSQSYWETRPTT